MPRGTGLQFPRTGDVTVQAPNVIDADQYSLARYWGQVAADGRQIAETGFDALARAEQQRRVGHLAEQEVEIGRKRLELEAQHRLDPQGFENDWEAYKAGKLEQAQPWAINHLTRALGSAGNASLRSIQTSRIAFDERQDAERGSALASQAANDVVGAAMAGTLHTPDGKVRIQKYTAVLDSLVTSNLMTSEKRDLILDETLSKAEGELAARRGVQTYREKGFDAAVQELRTNILENENLSLKGESRWKAYNRGVAAIRLQQAQDKQDRGEIVAVSKDLRARYESNQPVEQAELAETMAALRGAGAAAELQRLTVTAATSEATAPYRSGLRLREFATAVAGRRGGERATAAMQFFQSRGWTTAQAAGIVEIGRAHV